MGAGASVPGEKTEFKVGNRVIVNGKNDAVIKYIGPTKLATGTWFGVEFKKPLGSHNGTVKGHAYFTCKAGHGLMVRETQLQAFSQVAKASGTIGIALKKHVENRREELRIYNILDNHEEQLNLERRAKLGVALLAPEQAPSSEIGQAEIDAIEIEEGYTGPHLSWPLNPDTMLSMLKAFKEGKTLHSKYVLQLLHKFTAQNKKFPTVVKVSIKERSRLTIVGDTHGQLQDILHMLDINGVPDDYNSYLFNGDFVDRGDKGVEICMLIMGYQLLYPGVVHINRGNHECRSQTQVQGFMMEVLDKYNPRGRATRGGQPELFVSGGSKCRGNQVYEAFMQAFDSLPLASVVQGTVFVVHGGLFERRGVRLSHLEAVNRFREIPLTRNTFEDGLFQDMMWSDPQDERGVRPSSRGAGHFFGRDVTANFCRANNLHLVIRSHECVPDGFEFTHKTQLLTLFSASDYCGDTGNMGAFVVFKSADMQANIEQFMASQPASTPGPSRLARTHRAVIAKLVDLICASKHDLYWYFCHLDSRHTGTVSRVEWADALKTVLKLDLPFMRLVNDLATVDDHGRINYGRFLDRYKIDVGVSADWHALMVEKVYEKLVAACADVESAYKLFDVNDDGCVEYIEFVNALKKLDLGLSDAQLFDFMGYLDEDRDNHIDFREFINRFQVVHLKMAPVSEEEKKWARAKLSELGKVVFKLGDAAKDLFKELDTDNSGTLSLEQMAAGLVKLAGKASEDHPLSEAEAVRLAKDVDADGSGCVNYSEFVKAFRVNDSKKKAGSGSSRAASLTRRTPGAGAGGAGAGAGSGGGAGLKRVPTADLRESQEWDSANLEDLLTTLYEYRVELAASFRLFDVDNSGKVSEEEFKRGLEALKLPLNRPITPYQIRELMHILDKDGDGHLDYDEFLNGFSILNTETGEKSRQNYRKRA